MYVTYVFIKIITVCLIRYRAASQLELHLWGNLKAFLFWLSHQSDEMKWYDLICPLRVTFLNKIFLSSHDDKCEDASIRDPSLV